VEDNDPHCYVFCVAEEEKGEKRNSKWRGVKRDPLWIERVHLLEPKIISIISPSVIIIIIIIIQPCIYTDDLIQPDGKGKIKKNKKHLNLNLKFFFFFSTFPAMEKPFPFLFFLQILFHGETHDHDDPVGSKVEI
jgi:hypothetical protein